MADMILSQYWSVLAGYGDTLFSHVNGTCGSYAEGVRCHPATSTLTAVRRLQEVHNVTHPTCGSVSTVQNKHIISFCPKILKPINGTVSTCYYRCAVRMVHQVQLSISFIVIRY